MLHLSFLELIFRAIPESFALIFGMYLFSNIVLKPGKYIISSLLLATATYSVRFLPISYGMNTIISIMVLIAIAIYINEANLLQAVAGGIFSIVLLFICEGLNMFILQGVYGDKLINIFQNPVCKIISGLPSLIAFFIILAIYKLIINKRNLRNDVRHR
ncbi:MAG: hypothetical protein ACRCVJ_06955 [Clostridium sp.]|uniref:hypothetical protein n=1 Tax=Clostridium sp. TaxID=1506 RepID=UPI003F34327C